jgi:iron complex outermembrane receptor protein
LSSAARIEVLRGPFSALYGNSSGGVISVFTQEGVPGFEAIVRAAAGSFRTQRYSMQLDGESGPVNYLVDVAHFHTDGYRAHSQADRDVGNAKVKIDLGAASKLTLVANYVQTPANLDPLGLTRTQLDADPTQAGTSALAYNTRKLLDQGQFGVILDQRMGEHDRVEINV